jgi:hypothetical protein
MPYSRPKLNYESGCSLDRPGPSFDAPSPSILLPLFKVALICDARRGILSDVKSIKAQGKRSGVMRKLKVKLSLAPNLSYAK